MTNIQATIELKRTKKKQGDIMTDNQNPEWTENRLAQAKPAKEVLPESFFQEIKKLRGQRGAQKAPKKVPVSLRLDAEIVEAYKATGKGWQSRINDVLLNNLPRS